MVDFSLAPDVPGFLNQHAEVDYLAAERERLLERIGEYDAFWGHMNLRVDSEVLERAARLRVVCTATTGTDHIDRVGLERRQIALLSLEKDLALLERFSATAECAWMLILACARHLRAAMSSVFDGRWEGERFCGQQLSGRTLGVLGLGRLGVMSCRIGLGFGMRVLGCDRVPKPLSGVEQVDFETLLRNADVLTIHIHLDKSNYHLFDKRTFRKLKREAIVVNTSRGDIIDEEALVEALETRQVGAFGADVLHDEWRGDMRASPLVALAKTNPRVVITPHLGGATEDSIRLAREFMARKLVHFLETGTILSAS